MLPELVLSGCVYAYALGLFSDDALDHFMTGSNLFPYASVLVTAYTAMSAHVCPSLL